SSSNRPMKQAGRWCALVLLLLLANCGRKSSDTPSALPRSRNPAPSASGAQVSNKKNARQKIKNKKAAPVSFSHPRGFYDAAFELILGCDEPGAIIRFTTNGSAPTEASGRPYAGPISIRNTTVVRAAAFKPG